MLCTRARKLAKRVDSYRKPHVVYSDSSWSHLLLCGASRSLMASFNSFSSHLHQVPGKPTGFTCKLAAGPEAVREATAITLSCGLWQRRVRCCFEGDWGMLFVGGSGARKSKDMTATQKHFSRSLTSPRLAALPHIILYALSFA